MIPVFIGTTFLVYFMVFKLPGDPIRALFGDRQPPQEIVDAIRAQYNLDDPFLVQYGKYVAGIFRGDFGTTFNGVPVSEIIADAWPVTLRLAAIAFTVEVVVGLSLGIWAGLNKGRWPDKMTLGLTTLIISVPVFVFGFLAQLFLTVRFQIFPTTYNGTMWSLVLPGIVLALLSLAYVARLTRTTIVENMRADYKRTAVAKGLPPRRVTWVHVLRNSLIPVVTFLGADLGGLMAGAVVTEGIFNIPGIGNEIFRALQRQEPTVVVGIVTLLVIVYLVANLLVDLLYAVLDPRIRYE
jgi:ABC-type dipeptide/oligopeptide/nickel transport system permease component